MHLLLLCIPSLLFADDSLPPNTPDIVTCNFKRISTCYYDSIEKNYLGESKKENSFSFKIAGLSRGKPVLVGKDASSELKILKIIGSRIYLVENPELGLNIITLYLDTKQVSMTKQYGLAGVYTLAAVGELSF